MPLTITTGIETLERLLTRQLESNFLLDDPAERAALLAAVRATLPDVERCFSHVASRYYRSEQGEIFFDPYQTAQYGIFLYFLSRRLWKGGNGPRLAAKVYALNKLLNGCDLFYEVELPAIFSFDHPLGAVMGRAKYGDYFRFSQSCCVGNNNGAYPTLGECVTLFPYARVVGNCRIGNNVFISHGAYVKDTDIPDNSLIFGHSPHLVIKSRPTDYFHRQCGFLIGGADRSHKAA
jgi:serine O-acetyltransferase